MRTRLFSILLFVSMIASLVGATIPATTVEASGVGQNFFINHTAPFIGNPPPNISIYNNGVPGHTVIDATGSNVIQLDTRPFTAAINVVLQVGDWTGHLSFNSASTRTAMLRSGNMMVLMATMNPPL